MTHTVFDCAHLLALGFMLVACMWYDANQRRIPNMLVLWGSLTALGLSLSTLGIGLNLALAGGMVGFFIFGVLYRLGMVGAGDVKLVGATGFFLGYPDMFRVALFIFLAGGILSLTWAWCTGKLSQSVQNLHNGASLAWQRPQAQARRRFYLRVGSTRVPYALAIGAGTAIHVLSTWLGWPI
jgi:prepilin peptidase CpaA